MELKQCPFCGKLVAEISNCKELEECKNFEECDSGEYYCVVCDFNNGGCGASGGFRETEEQAIYVWNNRVLKPTGKWFKSSSDVWGCSECGYGKFIDILNGGVFPKHCGECGVKLDAPKGYKG